MVFILHEIHSSLMTKRMFLVPQPTPIAPEATEVPISAQCYMEKLAVLNILFICAVSQGHEKCDAII